jgi:hypothetical protein
MMKSTPRARELRYVTFDCSLATYTEHFRQTFSVLQMNLSKERTVPSLLVGPRWTYQQPVNTG